MQIRTIQISSKEYFEMVDLRMRVLLHPIGIPRSYINPEKESNDILVGAFEANHLIGCCILTQVDDTTLQLRQMAVDDSVQKSGIGAAIVKYAEEVANSKGYQVLMLHARDNVIGFYKRCGYNVYGDQFFEVGIGHHKMKKKLA